MDGAAIPGSTPGAGLPRDRDPARWFLCGAALTAMAAAVWTGLARGTCGDCGRAGALLGGIPLSWIGAGYYAVLAAAAAHGGFNRFLRAGFIAAAGIHVVLLMVMAQEHIFCYGCVLTAAAAMAGGMVSLAAPPRTASWGAMIFAMAVVLGLGGLIALEPAGASTGPALAQEREAGGPSAMGASGRVKLVVYEREGCKHCLEFEDDILPQVKKDLGDSFDVERRDADLTMETPTIIVEGNGTQEFVGVPQYQALEQAVRMCSP